MVCVSGRVRRLFASAGGQVWRRNQGGLPQETEGEGAHQEGPQGQVGEEVLQEGPQEMVGEVGEHLGGTILKLNIPCFRPLVNIPR